MKPGTYSTVVEEWLRGLVTVTAAKAVVRHPPQSGWLDEWGRLKGGCPVP
jgi:hypothetical protein